MNLLPSQVSSTQPNSPHWRQPGHEWNIERMLTHATQLKVAYSHNHLNPIMVRVKVRMQCDDSHSILTVASVVLLDHPVAPALVAPLYEPVKYAEAVDKPQVVLEVVYQRAVRLALPAQLDCRIFSELMIFYSTACPCFRLGSNAIYCYLFF